MTDPLQFDTVGADRTYIEPITPEHVAAILRKERPDALLPTLGGQTALNTALQTVDILLGDSGILEELGIEMIGADREVIRRAEDRLLSNTFLCRIRREKSVIIRYDNVFCNFSAGNYL
jgi:carbamoyl-phosphate synthase large subunit